MTTCPECNEEEIHFESDGVNVVVCWKCRKIKVVNLRELHYRRT